MLAFLLLGPARLIPLHVPQGYNEGWNAYFDARAVLPGSGPLYPPPDAMIFNNYPPLSFYVVGGLGRFVFGDMIVAGRVVALLSLLGSAGLLGMCVRRLGGCTQAAVAAGMLMLLFATTYYRDYVAVDDPQWLGHLVMLGGLAVLLRGGPAGPLVRRDVVLAALLVLVGGFIKHNLLALPVAVTLWLAWRDRRACAVWVGAATLGLAAGAALTFAAHGDIAFTSVLEHRRSFRVGRVTKPLERLVPFLPMLAAAGWLSRRRGGSGADPAVVLAVLFAGSGFVFGTLERLGQGVYYNAQFEQMLGICLWFGVAVSPVFAAPLVWRWRIGGAMLCGLVAWPPLTIAGQVVPLAWRQIVAAPAMQAAWRPVIDRIAAAAGAAACETLSLCYWAGKPFALDVFNETQFIETGGSAAALRGRADAGGFGIVEVTPSNFAHREAAMTMGYDPVLAAFARSYQPVGGGPDGTVLLGPRPVLPQ